MTAIDVTLDGRPLARPVAAIVERGRIFVGLRDMAAILPIGIAYDPTTRTILVTRGERRCLFGIDVRAYRCGDRDEMAAAAPRLANGRVYVPLRALAAAIGPYEVRQAGRDSLALRSPHERTASRVAAAPSAAPSSLADATPAPQYVPAVLGEPERPEAGDGNPFGPNIYGSGGYTGPDGGDDFGYGYGYGAFGGYGYGYGGFTAYGQGYATYGVVATPTPSATPAPIGHRLPIGIDIPGAPPTPLAPPGGTAVRRLLIAVPARPAPVAPAPAPPAPIAPATVQPRPAPTRMPLLPPPPTAPPRLPERRAAPAPQATRAH